jgi:hypothetical protein
MNRPTLVRYERPARFPRLRAMFRGALTGVALCGGLLALSAVPATVIVAVVLAGWIAIALPVAFVLGRMIRVADEHQPEPEPDFLWGQPTDCLSDAAIDVRFQEITGQLGRVA